jgi:hypothetical protein
MSPEQLLEAMAEVYATCSTYRDAGRVTTRFHSPDCHQPGESVRPFTTAFCRPNRFRFEYRDRFDVEDEWHRYVVWSDGPAVKTWWGLYPEGRQPESLGLALAGATGVSGGSAHTVPALLLPDRIGGHRLTELTELVSLGDVPLGEVTCYRLSGQFPPAPLDPAREEQALEVFAQVGVRPQRAEHSPVTVWIDRGTLLVRRIEESVQFETFASQKVTEYEPEVGITLSDDELQFGARQTAEQDAAPGPAA